MKIDLQLHSTYSDGYLTPSQLASLLAKQKVRVASLTDHNTVGGQSEFKSACRKKRIKTITGIEIFTKHENYIFNILWYNFDDTSPQMHDLLRDSQVRRRQLVRSALKKMVEAGFVIEIDRTTINALGYHPARYVGAGCNACGVCFYACPEPGAVTVRKDSALVKGRKKKDED